MPSGAKKRKAAKKKFKEAHKNGARPNVALGNDYPKSHDGRESDSGEVDRDSCDESTVSSHAEGEKEIDVVDQNHCRGFEEVTADADNSVGESHNGDAKNESKSSSTVDSDDGEIVIEKEEQIVAEIEFHNSVKDDAVISVDNSPKVASSENKMTFDEYTIEESVPIIESVEHVSLPEKLNVVSESVLVDNSECESEFKQNVDENLDPVDEKDKVRDWAQQKIEHDIQGNEHLLPMSSGGNWRQDRVKESENHKILEEKHLVSSLPSPMRRTSWINCCGLFEVLRSDSSA